MYPIIETLNEYGGRNYKVDRLNKEGKKLLTAVCRAYDNDTIHKVIITKAMQWRGDPDNGKYLRPETLFRMSNFQKYIDEYKYYQSNKQALKALYEKYKRRIGLVTQEEIVDNEFLS
jgi:uncharacterized phage protein (TIGR02220 family)